MKQPEHWKVTDTLKHQYVKQVQILTCTAKFIYATFEIRFFSRIYLFSHFIFLHLRDKIERCIVFTKSPPGVAVERWGPGAAPHGMQAGRRDTTMSLDSWPNRHARAKDLSMLARRASPASHQNELGPVQWNFACKSVII